MNVSATIPRIVYDYVSLQNYRVNYAIELPEVGEVVQVKFHYPIKYDNKVTSHYTMSRDLFQSLVENQCYTELTPYWAHISYHCSLCHERLNPKDALQVQLEIALEQEDYESAADIRDMMLNME